MAIKIALAGNPNSGKTTLFNDLTGSAQRVGNWPGVTVEKKEGRLKGRRDIFIQDLPGIYSLSPYTPEEIITRNYLIEDRPDVVINIIDASNIERNLYLTTQILELGIPVIIALNMIDIVRKRGDVIEGRMLGEALGCEVVETSAVNGTGCVELVEKAIALAGTMTDFNTKERFSPDIEESLSRIQDLIKGKASLAPSRWTAIKVFERDKEVLKNLSFSDELRQQVDEIINGVEKEYDDDSESLITSERYLYIGHVVADSVQVNHDTSLSTSDKIDKVVTNRILALPVFIMVMFMVYFVSISTVGTRMTDWVNDALFDEGFHFLGDGATEYEEKAEEYQDAQSKIQSFIEAAGEEGIDIEGLEAALAFEAGKFDDGEVAEAEEAKATERIDTFIKAAQEKEISTEAGLKDEEGDLKEILIVTPTEFEAALEIEEPDPADYGTWVPGIPELAEKGLDVLDTADWLKSLIIDGIIAGVGAVLGFLPQMLVLFFCLAILEYCGYMARVAFIMDRIFRKFGLSGKSFIPIMIGTGCGVPGIMAARTIENQNDRRMTVITTTFIPCGAKLPIIALITGALFPGSIWVAPSAYFAGIGAIIISGIILKKTRLFAGDPAPFVMELPAYHLPKVKSVLMSMLNRGMAFVKKAGTIVLLATIGVWFLSSFNWSMEMVGTEESILAEVGRVIAPVFNPLGWGDWKATVATFTGLIAKENVVGTFGILYGFAEVAEDGEEIWDSLKESFTPISAYSFLLFNLLCAPCFAAIGAVRREMANPRWTLFAIAFQTALAYVVALIFYQLALSFTEGYFGIGTVIGITLLAWLVYLLVRKPYAPPQKDDKDQN